MEDLGTKDEWINVIQVCLNTKAKRKISTKQIENEWHTWLWQAGREQDRMAKHKEDADAWQQSEDDAIYLVAEGAREGTPTLKIDLRSMTSMTGEQALEFICNKAGVERKDVRFVWSSPPCETHSRANE